VTLLHEPIRLGAMTIRFLLESEETGGALSVFRCDLPAGSRVPAPHSHDAFDETAYGLEGVTTFTVGGVEHEIGPGETLFIPRGVVHGFSVGDEDTAVLFTATPGLFGPAYFNDMAEVIGAGRPPDLDAVFAVMRRHGLTPAAPNPG
jgi:quercetin dioxygenase-like cupin family protein